MSKNHISYKSKVNLSVTIKKISVTITGRQKKIFLVVKNAKIKKEKNLCAFNDQIFFVGGS